MASNPLPLPPGATLVNAPQDIKLPPGATLVSKPEEKTITGFLSNAVSSARKFASDVTAPILHPVDTLKGVTGLVQGMAEKTGFPAVNGQSHEQSVDALVKHYTERYGSWDGFTHALYTDPVGIAADVATLASGTGAAAKGVEVAADAAKLGKVADAAGTVAKGADAVSSVTDPLRVATKGAGVAVKAADKVAPVAADALRRSSLRGGFSVNTPAADVTDAVSSMRDTGAGAIQMSEGGAKKISDALTDLRTEIDGRVAARAQAGGEISPGAVRLRLNDTRQKFSQQVNPTSDLRDIDKVEAEFVGNNPGPIPTDQAQAMKVGSNSLNGAKYGKVSSAQVEAEKALTRGLREELENQIPELANLNAQQSKLMNLDDILGKAVNKYTNSGGFKGNLLSNTFSGAGVGVGGATFGFSHDPMLGVSAAVMQAILSDPVVKSRLATAIDLAAKASPNKWGTPRLATGLARVEQLATGLSRVNAGEGNKP